MEEHTLFKFHCTYGETKKLVSSAVKDLKTAIELKFSVKDPFLIKLYVTEVEDYIEWDSDSEMMVAAEPSSKIWKVVIEKPKAGDSGGGGGDARTAANANSYGGGYGYDPYGEARPEPPLEPDPQNKLFVGNLDDSVKKDDLKKLFEAFGTVVECDKVRDFGFVHFKEKSEAQAAMKHLNQTEFRKKTIRVKIARTNFRQKPGMGGSGCYICGQNDHRSNLCPRDPRSQSDSRYSPYDRPGADPYRRPSPYDPYYSRYADPRYPAAPSTTDRSPATPGASDRYRPYPADPYRRPLPPPAPRDPYTDPYYARDYYGAKQPPPRDPYASAYYAPRIHDDVSACFSSDRSTYGTSTRDEDSGDDV